MGRKNPTIDMPVYCLGRVPFQIVIAKRRYETDPEQQVITTLQVRQGDQP